MNARLIKETRVLLPMFVGTLPLIVALTFIESSGDLGYIALGVACVVMAGTSFGAEFQHRTLPLLLSQPIARSVLWREKVLVLAAGLVASLAALMVCLGISRSAISGLNWLALALIPLCAFCGAPFWTLSLRNGFIGMVSTVAVPCGMLAVYALVTELFGLNEPVVLGTAVVLLLVMYCARVYWLGYARFQRLEDVEIPARELRLPAGVEALFTRPVSKASSRFRGPFASLLKKEFRLQQVCFLLASVFLLVAAAGCSLARRYPEVAAGTVGGDLFLYALILPLFAGAASVAEERGWGVAEWHLTLPPSTLKQWSAKLLAALSTSFVLGLLLPTAVFLAADPLFSRPDPRPPFPPAFAILAWVLGQMLLTSLAIYAASCARTTMQALISSLVMLVAAGGILFVALRCVNHSTIAPVQWLGQPRLDQWLILPLLSAALILLLCLFHSLAWSNFRHFSPRIPTLMRQFVTIPVAVWLIGWFYFSALLHLSGGF